MGKKMIKFELITLENFMQYKEVALKFKNGLNQIIGANRSGKSSIIEALFFCLYGQTARNTKDVIRKGFSRCTVVVHGYKGKEHFNITRDLGSRKKLILQINKKEPIHIGDLKLDQINVNNFIGYNFEQFMSAVLFGHNSFRFTRAKDSERKKVLDSVIDFSGYDNARKYCTTEQSKMATQMNSAEVLIDDAKDIITENNENIKQSGEKGLIKIINDLENERKELNKENLNMNNKIDYSDEIEKLEDQDNNLTLEKNKLQKTLRSMGSTCPVCHQKIKVENQKHIKTHIVNLDKNQVKVSNKLIKYELMQEEYNTYSANKDRIDDIRAELVDNRRLRKLSIEPYKKAIERSKLKINNEMKKHAQADRMYKVYKFWFQGFSRSGAPGYLIDSFIEDLNINCIKASQEITDSEICVQFTPFTTSKTVSSVQERISMLCYLDGEEYEYEQMSNSEQQRADMIVMVAWRLLYDKMNKINLVFFDEVFEGLDSGNCDIMVEYIKSFSKGKCTYLISHTLNNKFDKTNIINVIRTKNGSKIK